MEREYRYSKCACDVTAMCYDVFFQLAISNALRYRDEDKPDALELAKQLDAAGFELCATHGTAKALKDAGLECKGVNKVREGQPHVVDMLKNDEIDFIINTTDGKKAIADSYSIRRTALQHKVFYLTTIAAARAAVTTLQGQVPEQVYCLQQLHEGLEG